MPTSITFPDSVSDLLARFALTRSVVRLAVPCHITYPEDLLLLQLRPKVDSDGKIFLPAAILSGLCETLKIAKVE